MKIKTNYEFPEQYRDTAEEYISYKHSLGFKFGYDDLLLSLVVRPPYIRNDSK